MRTNSVQHPTLSPWWSLSIVPYLWIVLVLLIASAYTFPQTDDYCTFGRLYFKSFHNPLRETWLMYESWTGRYSASFMVAAVGWLASVIPLPLQWVYAGSLMAFLCLLFFASIRASQLVNEERRVNVPLASIIFAAMVVFMPSKLEGLLWLTGVAVYSLGLVMLPLMFHSILRDEDTDQYYSYRSLAYIVIAVGVNEFIGLAVGAYLGLRALLNFKEARWVQRNAAYIATFATAFAVTVLAPGNFVRDATISAKRHNLHSTFELSMQSADIFLESHIQPYWGTLLGLAIAAMAAGWLLVARSQRARSLLPIAAVLLASFPMHFLVYSFLTGEQVPGRVINQAYAMGLVGYVLLSAWVGSRLAEQRRHFNARGVAAAIVAAYGVCLVASPAVRNVATTTRDFGPTWIAEQSKRHHDLLTAGRGANAVVAPLTREISDSPVLQGADMTAESGYWINTCTADFYQLGSITLRAQ